MCRTVWITTEHNLKTPIPTSVLIAPLVAKYALELTMLTVLSVPPRTLTAAVHVFLVSTIVWNVLGLQPVKNVMMVGLSLLGMDLVCKRVWIMEGLNSRMLGLVYALTVIHLVVHALEMRPTNAPRVKQE